MRLLFFTFLFSISAPIFSQDTIKLKDGEFEKDIFYYLSTKYNGMAYSNYSRRKPKAEYNFIEGHKVGLCREWYKNGSLKEKGTRCEVNEVIKWCGLYQKWYQNGILAFEKNDTPSGEIASIKTWYSNGVLFNEKKFLEGKLSDFYSWHSNGRANEEYHFKFEEDLNSFHGKWKKSSEDGDFWEERNYVLGKLQGKTLKKTINGLLYEKNYKNGLLHGKFHVFKKDSILIYETTFKNGSGILREYNKKGKVTSEKSFTQYILNWEKTFKKSGKIKTHKVLRVNNNELLIKQDTISGNRVYYHNEIPFHGETYIESDEGFNTKECKYENGMFISCKEFQPKETDE